MSNQATNDSDNNLKHITHNNVIHIKRIFAKLEPIVAEQEKTSENTTAGTLEFPIRFLLNELSKNRVCIFSPSPLMSGQQAKFKLNIIEIVEFKVKVLWCQEHYSNSHIISKDPFHYRMNLEFVLTPEEAEQFQSLYNYLVYNQPLEKKAA